MTAQPAVLAAPVRAVSGRHRIAGWDPGGLEAGKHPPVNACVGTESPG